MLGVSCVPPMKEFHGNPLRQNSTKMSIRSLRVLQTIIKFMRIPQNGVYVSTDRWKLVGNTGLKGCLVRYGTAIAVHPADPDLLIATVQNGPRGGGAWLCRSENGGATWTQLNDQLTESTDRISTGCIAFTSDGTAWAVIGKTLYIGQNRATAWSPFWTAPEYDGVYQPPSDDFSLTHLLEYPIQTLAV